MCIIWAKQFNKIHISFFKAIVSAPISHFYVSLSSADPAAVIIIIVLFSFLNKLWKNSCIITNVALSCRVRFTDLFITDCSPTASSGYYNSLKHTTDYFMTTELFKKYKFIKKLTNLKKKEKKRESAN